MPQLDLIKSFQFEAAHLTDHRDNTSCLHGHSYSLDLIVEGPLDTALGWVMDYADISKAFAPIYNQLDHQTLNHIEGLSDTRLPGLRTWIVEHTKLCIPALKDIRVGITGACAFDPTRLEATQSPDLPDRLRFGFEAAHALEFLPPDHKCHTMHGHSFTVEVASKNLKTLIPELEALYAILDHQCLNDIEGLENPTSENLCIWIWNQLHQNRDDVIAVLVAETCTARCIYRGH